MKRLQFLCFFLLPALLFSSFSLSSATSASAQTYPTDDPVIKQMWELGVENSQTRELAHELVDVIGPRLAGSSNLLAAQDWMVQKYEDWGIPVRKEEYGTWQGWEASRFDDPARRGPITSTNS